MWHSKRDMLFNCKSNHQNFQKCLDFSWEALLLYIMFTKIRKPNDSKTERRKGHTRPPGQPWGEELPCRFLSCPGGSREDILDPQGSHVWGRAALQVPFLSRTLSRTGRILVAPDSVHVFPILNPPPTVFPIPSLCVIPVHQPRAPCIMHWTWTGNLFHIR